MRQAGVRYRNPYQTRHTYASMLLSNGENIMWVAKQLGHVNVEMVIRTYGKWIPDNSISTGYKLVNDWGKHLQLEETNCSVYAPQGDKIGFFSEKIQLNQSFKLAEWTGLEPATPGVTGRYSNQLNYHSALI